jgi:hypothetical protein
MLLSDGLLLLVWLCSGRFGRSVWDCFLSDEISVLLSDGLLLLVWLCSGRFGRSVWDCFHSISWLFFAYLEISLVRVCTCAWVRWIYIILTFSTTCANLSCLFSQRIRIFNSCSSFLIISILKNRHPGDSPWCLYFLLTPWMWLTGAKPTPTPDDGLGITMQMHWLQTIQEPKFSVFMRMLLR